MVERQIFIRVLVIWKKGNGNDAADFLMFSDKRLNKISQISITIAKMPNEAEL